MGLNRQQELMRKVEKGSVRDLKITRELRFEALAEASPANDRHPFLSPRKAVSKQRPILVDTARKVCRVFVALEVRVAAHFDKGLAGACVHAADKYRRLHHGISSQSGVDELAERIRADVNLRCAFDQRRPDVSKLRQLRVNRG